MNALDLFRSGMDTKEISEFLCCSEPTVYNVIHKLKEADRLLATRAEAQRQRRRAISDGDIATLMQSGSVRDAANQLGVTRQAVYQRLRKMCAKRPYAGREDRP